MIIFNTKQEWIELKKNFAGDSVGFVPTMGALHPGHESLIKKSLTQNDATVVSIFVNPTQFDNPRDLNHYPRLLEKDILILKKLNVDFLFLPKYEYLYRDGYKYKITETDLSKRLCGASRPGHFNGVLTVVMKLLNIISPDKAYFGEKDYQQLLLVKGMAETFFMDVEIIPCPIVRESDGLAMSSRNLRLTKEERAKASLFPKLLKSNLTDEEIKKKLKNNDIKVDYIETINKRRFGAVFLGNVRLIDNVKK